MLAAFLRTPHRLVSVLLLSCLTNPSTNPFCCWCWCCCCCHSCCAAATGRQCVSCAAADSQQQYTRHIHHAFHTATHHCSSTRSSGGWRWCSSSSAGAASSAAAAVQDHPAANLDRSSHTGFCARWVRWGAASHGWPDTRCAASIKAMLTWALRAWGGGSVSSDGCLWAWCRVQGYVSKGKNSVVV